jgi:ABC-2 type transport system permease protein
MIIANIIAIFRKELQSYFASPFAYIVAAIFWLISGLFFGFFLYRTIQGVALAEQEGLLTNSVDVASEFFSAFFETIISLCLVLLPALSMGLYAEERKRGTLELLATSPLTNWSVAVGKLLGVVTFFITMLIPIFIYETIVLSASNPPMSLQVILLSNAGMIILAAVILSLGMFISSLTDSSILAYILTFVSVLFLWILDVFADNIGGVLGEVLSHLSLFQNYQDLIRGVFDTSSLVLFVSYIFLGIFLTAQSIEALRLQRS